MSNTTEIIRKIIAFRDARDWKQFHNPKDLSIALSIEANELMELFLWKKDPEVEQVDQEKIREELADIFSFAFLLLDHYGFDLATIMDQKYEKNKMKYPVEKAKGKATKYKDL